MLIYQVVLWSCRFLMEEWLSYWSLHSSLGNLSRRTKCSRFLCFTDTVTILTYVFLFITLLPIIAKYRFPIRALLYQGLLSCLRTKTLWIVSAKVIGHRNERSLLVNTLWQTFHLIGWFLKIAIVQKIPWIGSFPHNIQHNVYFPWHLFEGNHHFVHVCSKIIRYDRCLLKVNKKFPGWRGHVQLRSNHWTHI